MRRTSLSASTWLGAGFAPLVVAGLMASASADGWHSVPLQTSSMEQWWAQNMTNLERAAPQPPKGTQVQAAGDKNKTTELRSGADAKKLGQGGQGSKPAEANKKSPGGKLQNQAQADNPLKGELSQQQKYVAGRIAADSLETLAYMDTRNIIPREFPDFDLRQIPALSRCG
jgi:hypothetical protein